jgi:hypothetical protein
MFIDVLRTIYTSHLLPAKCTFQRRVMSFMNSRWEDHWKMIFGFMAYYDYDSTREWQKIMTVYV